METSKADNHAKAPIAAAFVEAMRAEFGDVKVLYVKEGDFEAGKVREEHEPR